MTEEEDTHDDLIGVQKSLHKLILKDLSGVQYRLLNTSNTDKKKHKPALEKSEDVPMQL